MIKFCFWETFLFCLSWALSRPVSCAVGPSCTVCSRKLSKSSLAVLKFHLLLCLLNPAIQMTSLHWSISVLYYSMGLIPRRKSSLIESHHASHLRYKLMHSFSCTLILWQYRVVNALNIQLVWWTWSEFHVKTDVTKGVDSQESFELSYCIKHWINRIH